LKTNFQPKQTIAGDLLGGPLQLPKKYCQRSNFFWHGAAFGKRFTSQLIFLEVADPTLHYAFTTVNACIGMDSINCAHALHTEVVSRLSITDQYCCQYNHNQYYTATLHCRTEEMSVI